MSVKFNARGCGLVAIAFVATTGMVGPASAQGFFEQLFGLGRAPSYEAPFAAPENAPPPVVRRRHVEAVPTLQKPTDLMHDKTLRVGDAVMMKDGIHIYDGSETGRHTVQDFVRLDDVDGVPSTQRQKLAALDVTRVDPVVEGRSNSNIVNGFRITDARGASIRYVGP